MNIKRTLVAASVAALALLPLPAWSNIIPTGTTITGTGPYVWNYNLKLSIDQNVNSGVAPSGTPVPHDNLGFAGFVTIYDFAGYVAGSCTGPAGWVCTTQNVGFTPDDVAPIDNPAVTNITWALTSGSNILGQPNGVDLGVFSATSIYNDKRQASYASRGVKNIGSQSGTISDNVGNIQAPVATSVPEPSSMAFVGFAALALLRNRKRFV